MPIGTSLGVVFGLLIFEKIGIGLPLGVGLGVAIGAALDANAKKKGLVL
ncbi:glycine zipper family protein [Oceanobacillus iheyensis]|nr:glycine zipper family protein [Oceanobacillus iheyensis]